MSQFTFNELLALKRAMTVNKHLAFAILECSTAITEEAIDKAAKREKFYEGIVEKIDKAIQDGDYQKIPKPTKQD